MAYETIEQTPSLNDFILLAEHQERTPITFFGGKPILHLHCPSSKLRISAHDLVSQPDFAALEAGGGNHVDDVVELPNLDVWVNSRSLTIYSAATSSGLQICYPAISMHAQDGAAVLLELNLSDANTADEDLVFLQMRLVPVRIADHAAAQHTAAEGDSQLQSAQQNGDAAESSPVVQLYNAISACQELNPDPEDADEDSMQPGFDETAPGATGWITSENLQDFVGEDGEFRMPGEGVAMVGGEATEQGEVEGETLGAGAGRRRTAAEVNGEDGSGDEAKWQRTG